MKLVWQDDAREDYLYWQTQDHKTLKRINALLASIQRDGPESGLGKPEPLRHRPGWSRRINEKDRILYHLVESGDIRITSLRGHYED